MRHTLASLAVLLVLAIPGMTRADDTKEFLKAENWEGLEDLWKVDGTTVTGTAKTGLKFNTFLCSKAKYSNFELSFKVQLKGGIGNSGVQIRSKIDDRSKFVVAGPQCDIGAQYWGSLYGERFGGMMKASSADVVKSKVKADGVNEYHILCKDNRVTITINGTVMTDGEYKMPADGILAFQLHAGPPMEVVYSDIVFKNLSK
ncbi:3-keto-disaccharide hydrolase [Tuwongella immobilis]|uniref:3-keto-alpha-glucoside-1,2-lyase/3-keto-2-hydroxy-glucal hydratase domain-containing protein n=1 Tax=Tuwongella immobilis TaxID=692036 RepID=A0A6C2YMQ1_9BACT|nr:DUF1080 domain-containing protein [Tuwongella immobilis]VIP02870.1 Uncharacterized protein OS=Isosphaera pallida (strain ATCC 43644 / DSM 9630 / IS1B) GN=Isop_3656 PE=4 SV=1: DUF1080 [Tuwongella immobilis]VTS02698.1 Uncharacterized protein OS=Isosphaera pallida (strain ATCC 43644 / DSM 9630 / IS1B) GN=Isop_3656 PE=4 SV=1: DUF1080 [Tuwongella immobilis]